MKDLRIVIPARNEEASIGEVIDRVRKACPKAEIVVVDDASNDMTAQIARGKGVEVISNLTNRGKGGATKIGLKHKSGNNINYLGFIDADITYPPESIPELYKLCKEQDIQIVVGSRFLGKNKGMSALHKVGNKIFAVMLSFYSGRRITDTSTGLRVFNAQLLPMFETLPDGLDFDTAMTTMASFEKLRYTELPIEYTERIGKSKLNSLRDGYRFLRVIMNATRKYRPLLFFCTLGLPFMLINYVIKIFHRTKIRNG